MPKYKYLVKIILKDIKAIFFLLFQRKNKINKKFFDKLKFFY